MSSGRPSRVCTGGPGPWDPDASTFSSHTDCQPVSLGQRAGGLGPCLAGHAGPVCAHDAWPSPKTCLLAAAELASCSLALLKPSVCPGSIRAGCRH